MHRFGLMAILGVLMVGCGERPLTLQEDHTMMVSLPDGKAVRAEVMVKPDDLLRGMMYRDSLAEDRGMLFIHEKAGLYRYWMFRVKIPLDIIWMDSGRRIVEIAAKAPPCTTGPKDCPNYGGSAESQYVLELGGGVAAKHGLKVGDTLQF
jgi:uncharacterized protein